MMSKYILRGKVAAPCGDILVWRKWFEESDRVIARDEFNGVRVSTVFLGIDHRFIGDGPPLLFETMIFGGEHDGYQERYSTWDEAEAGHKRAVEKVKGA